MYKYLISGVLSCFLVLPICAQSAPQYSFNYESGKTTATSPLGGIDETTFAPDKRILSELVLPRDRSSMAQTLYTYDANDYPATVTYPNGSRYITHYNPQGLLLSETDSADTPLAFTTNYTWTADRLPQTVAYSSGLTIRYTYDTHRKPLTVTKTDGEISPVWYYTYDKWGQTLTAQAPYNDSDHVLKYTYNSGELLSSLTNQLGQTVTYNQYDEMGNVLSETDENNVTTTYTYDALGLLLTSTINGATTSFSYDKNSHFSTVTTPEGIIKHYQYNYWSDLKQLTDANGNKTIQTIDSMGNVTQKVVQDSLGNERYKINYAYNSLNELKSITDANGNITSLYYDPSGNLTKQVNAQGAQTQNQYNVSNQVKQSKNALSNTAYFTYTPAGNVASITDYNGNKTSYQYNAFNQLTQVSSPDRGTITYHYNTKGQLQSQTDGNANTRTYVYDQLNRVIAVNHNGNAIKQYTYDQGQYGIGRLSASSYQNSEIDNSYDAFGNVIQQDYIINGNKYSVAYAYNKDQQIKTLTYPSGLIVNFTRDKVGNINAINAENAAQQISIAADIAYLPFGPVQSLTYGNGSQLTRTYDEAYQLLKQTVSGVAEDSYVYDKIGNITQFVSTNDPDKSKSYAYDAIERLTAMKSALETEDFSYDANSNRLTYNSSKQGKVSYEYDYASNRLQTYQDSNKKNSVSHDKNGNITALGDLSFSYDVFNNLIAVKKNSQPVASYQYNSNNQRVTKLVNGVSTLFVYDINGKLLEIRQANSITDIVYLNGEPIAQLVNGKIYYFVNDALGTPEYLTGANGEKPWSGNIYPFKVDASGQVQQDLRFSGQINNSETGLVYNNAREYVPFLGRYLQADPSGLRGRSFNNYTYAKNNPVNLLDTTGRCPICIEEEASILGGDLAAGVGGEGAGTSFTQQEVIAEEAEMARSAQAEPEDIASETQAAKEGEACAVKKVNGRIPINSKYAGKEHPEGTYFKESGFPDFDPYSINNQDVEGLTGNYKIDERLTNKQAGYKKTPEGYVWHHHENGKTMQLIPKAIHNAVRHTGGAAIIRGCIK